MKESAIKVRSMFDYHSGQKYKITIVNDQIKLKCVNLTATETWKALNYYAPKSYQSFNPTSKYVYTHMVIIDLILR